MKFAAGTRTRLLVTMTLDFDPTGSTVEVSVDGTWHAASWQGSPTNAGGKWTQTARTTDYFAGPDVASPGGATALTLGRHPTQTRVTSGTDIITADATPIDVD